MRDYGNQAPARHFLGNYEIFEEIGRGGMGIVYRALDLSLDRIVALKILRDDLRAQPQIVSRFKREAKAAACLDHPNIVQIYSVGVVDRTPYIAMEYIDAVPLSTIMQRGDGMQWEAALAIAGQVASALACAHEAHVIHRDIKPPNILITEQGKAYVMDFGIAKILTMDDNLTVDGSRLGTPHYMSPERCKNEDLTGSSDLYSLGVLLFQMLTGRLPYEAGSSVALIRQIVADPPARARWFRPDLPEDVERLIAWMIEKDPRHRPANGRALCDAIRRVRKGQPLEAGSSPMAHVLADFRHASARPARLRAPEKLATGLTPITEVLQGPWRGRVKGAAVCALGVLIIVTAALVAGRTHRTVTPWDTGAADPARWYAPAEAASISDEAPGVLLARFNLKGFTIDQIDWAESGSLLAVQLSEKERTYGESYRTLAGLDPVARRSGIIMPYEWTPRAAGNARLKMLAFAGAGPLAGRCLVAWHARESAAPAIYAYAPSREPAESATLLARLPRVSEDVVSGAVLPDGSALALVTRDTEGAERLSQWELTASRTLEAGFEVAPPGPAITGVQYAPDGRHLAYLRDDGNGAQALWVNPSEDEAVPRRPVARGHLTVSAPAFSPDSRSLAFAETDASGVSQVWTLQYASSLESRRLGPGRAVCWHPAGGRLLVVAPDRKDYLQLWVVEASTPFRRAQLTYLDGGISPLITVSSDGVWAAAPAADRDGARALVLVNVSEAVFQ